MSSEKILVIDDDLDLGLLLVRFLKKQNYEAEHVTNGTDSLELLRQEEIPVILCDYKLPDINGLELLQKIKILSPHSQVIIITGYSDIQVAIESIKRGALDYVVKPLLHEEIAQKVKDAFAINKIKPDKVSAKKERLQSPKARILGEDQKSKDLFQHIKLVGPTDFSVLIQGETGTGKEAVARFIHQFSNRKDGPFVAIDCGALGDDIASSELFGHLKGAFTGAITDKEGFFESAKGGTVFLDEIGNLSYENQVKLLRVIQERKIRKLGSTKDIQIDVRIISATNDDLHQKSTSGDEFREDLYHRLNEFKITIHPLRERKDDIPVFANFFLEEVKEELNNIDLSIDDSVISSFRNYSWPGNLREMRNVIRRSALLSSAQGGVIDQSLLPNEVLYPANLSSSNTKKGLKGAQYVAETKAIVDALKETNGNKSKAARLLGIDRKTLYNKLKWFELE